MGVDPKNDAGVALEGATVLVTGSSRGLGLSMVRCLKAQGLRVIATCRDVKSAEAILPTDVEVHALDLSDPQSISKLTRTLENRAIDFLVNNAAIRGNVEGLKAMRAPEFLEVMMVNTLAPLLLVQAFLPQLRLGRRRVVTNISSRVGSMAEGYDIAGDYAYRCSKAALNMATVKLAGDFREEGLTIMSLHPGWVKTDMGGAEAEISPEESAAGLVSLILSADQRSSGSFRNYDGTPISW